MMEKIMPRTQKEYEAYQKLSLPILSRPCPICDAPAGMMCVNSRGEKRSCVHQERKLVPLGPHMEIS
jgi:hypothetical protein